MIAQSTLSGEYALTAMREMASAFLFGENQSFEFYYVYGAVDRHAKGSYEIHGDTVRLKSLKIPGNDFSISLQKKVDSKCQLKFQAPNPYLVKHIKCMAFYGERREDFETDDDGIIMIPGVLPDKIFVQHQLYPDIPTLIKDVGNENNYFELTLQQSLIEVSFKGIDLFIRGEELTMLPNYFMPYENIVYRKGE